MTEPLISIIILNYNGLNDLKECFDSLYNLNYKNLELVFVDNNSQDKSVEFVEENYEDVKIVKLKKNYGFAQGNNYGVSQSNGEYIILLNNDTVVDKNWVSELVKIASSSKNIGVVGSKIYYFDDRITINFAGSSNNIFGQCTQTGDNRTDSKLLNKVRKSFFACGAAMLFKREVYQKIGLFDPKYFIYYEDADFCWRAWIFGYDVLFGPKSFLYHKIGRVMRNYKQKKYLGERNRLRTLLINYEKKSLIKILPYYFFHWIIKIYEGIQNKKKSTYVLFLIYLKAISWNIRNLGSLIIRRKYFQSNRVRNDKFIFQLMKELQTTEKNIMQ